MSDFWESRRKMGESPYLNLSCEVVQENLRKIVEGRKEEIDAELMAGMMIHMANCEVCEIPKTSQE